MANKENKEIAKIEENPVNALVGLNLMSDFKGQASGLDVMDKTDYKLPSFTLLQPTSMQATGPDRLAPGFFYNSLTKKAQEFVDLKFLYLSKTRAMWKMTFKRGEEADCKSYDNIRGSKYGACANCEHAKWGANNEKPRCNMSYSWLALENGDPSKPCRILASGTSVSITKDFLNILAQTRHEPYMFTVKLSSKFESNDKGAFYTLKYDIISNLAMEVMNRLGITDPANVTPEFKDKLKEAVDSYNDVLVAYKNMFSKQMADFDSDEVIEDTSSGQSANMI